MFTAITTITSQNTVQVSVLNWWIPQIESWNSPLWLWVCECVWSIGWPCWTRHAANASHEQLLFCTKRHCLYYSKEVVTATDTFLSPMFDDLKWSAYLCLSSKPLKGFLDVFLFPVPMAPFFVYGHWHLLCHETAMAATTTAAVQLCVCVARVQ